MNTRGNQARHRRVSAPERRRMDPENRQRLVQGTFWFLGSVASAATALFGGQVLKDSTLERVNYSIAATERVNQSRTAECLAALNDPVIDAIEEQKRFGAVLRSGACGTDIQEVGEIFDLDRAMKNFVQNERTADTTINIAIALAWSVSLGLFWKGASEVNAVAVESFKAETKRRRPSKSVIAPVSPAGGSPVAAEQLTIGEPDQVLADTSLPPRTLFNGSGMPSYLVEPGDPTRLA